MKLKTGDKVVVIAGANKGKEGKITHVLENRVVIEGVNIVKKHRKPTANSQGQIVEMEKPVHVSNVSLTENGKPARVGFKVEDGKKVRIFKKTGNKIGN